jgi:tetratricopeptide (TPR) repeat protein
MFRREQDGVPTWAVAAGAVAGATALTYAVLRLIRSRREQPIVTGVDHLEEAAVDALRRAIELGVGDYELRFVLGQSLIVLKRWPEAHALFTALVAERSDHGDAWLELAIARLRTGDLPAAEEALARARATGNASPRLLGDVERSLGNARERRTRRESWRVPESIAARWINSGDS